MVAEKHKLKKTKQLFNNQNMLKSISGKSINASRDFDHAWEKKKM